jgi:signal transduction histidine kinase
MAIPLQVLILEDLPTDALLMVHELRRAGFDPVWRRVETEADYVAHLQAELDVILADYRLPQFNALRALQLLRERGGDTPFIIVSAMIGEELAVAAMKQGAADYLLKDRLARLGPAVTRALQEVAERRARQQAAAAERQRAQELAQALDDLQQVQAQLLQSEKLAALGRLSAGIAHELNSPLQGLLGLLTVYLGRVPPASREADQLAKMRAACEHMATILADLMAFARPASEDRTALDLREVVQTTLGFSAVHLRHQDIRVTTHLAEAVPPISGNKSQLQQVLLNLLQNASDAIPGTGEIVIRVAAVPPEVLVQVRDTGVGMAPEHLAHIFEPFFTTKLPGQGTGLGLAVTLGIIEAHSGTIRVESTPQVGTTVTVRLPIAPPEPAAEGAPLCPPPPES